MPPVFFCPWLRVPGDRGELSSTFRLTTPAWEQARFGYDKRLTYERAAALGIAIPRSYYPRDRAEAMALECSFPAILKPTVHESRNAFTQQKAWRVADKAALLARYDQAVALVGADAVVIQEMIPGNGLHQFSYAAVCRHGAPVASLVARRTRQYPIDFGYTSTYVESVEHAEVEEAAIRFLRSIDYSGLVEVEFKYDPRDGRTKILDVNMRAWTWIALGALAGVDFPYFAWRLALGESEPLRRARTGVAWRHSARDLLAMFGEMRRGTAAASDCLRTFRQPRVPAAFAPDDPLPGLIELPITARRVLSRWWSVAQ